jgi:hypothetical protein
MEHISMHLPKPNESGGDFEIAPSGTWPAVCYAVIDLGTHDTEFQGVHKKKHLVRIMWELHDEECVMANGKPMIMVKTYTWSTHEKATLRLHLESWRGKAFDESEFGPGGFNIKKLLGVGCLIGVKHGEGKDGRTYANISSISKLPKGMNPGEPINSLIYLSLERDEFDEDVFFSLSDNTQLKIKESPEYKRLMSDEPEPSAGNAAFHGDPIPF